MYPILNEKIVPDPHVYTATFVLKIPKNQGFLVKNASNVLVNTTELHQFFVKIVKINRFYFFMPFLNERICPMLGITAICKIIIKNLLS